MPTATIEDVAQNPRIDNVAEPLNPSQSLPNSTLTNGGMSLRDYLQSDLYRQKQKRLDEKIRKLYDYGHDQEITKKVVPEQYDGGNLDYSEVDDAFSTATITTEALRKGNYISKRMTEIMGIPLEVYLFSLDDVNHDSRRVVKDLYIAKEQEVWPAKCHVSAYGVILSNLDIRDKLKKQVVGWSHSHAILNPFFSEEDRENIVRMLETSILRRGVRVFDSTFGGEGYKGVEYDVRYTPAIVFNARGAQPFVAIAVQYTRLYDGQKVFHINEHARLRVIEEANGIDMDPASIDRQILERCSYNGRKLEEIVDYRPEPRREEIVAPTAEEREETSAPATGIKQNQSEEQTKRDIRPGRLYGGLSLGYRVLQRNRMLRHGYRSGHHALQRMRRGHGHMQKAFQRRYGWARP